MTGSLALAALAAILVVFPRVVAYPMALISGWFAIALSCRGWKAWRRRR